MNFDRRIQELLEEILESRSAPEKACADDPDLLPEVVLRLRQLNSLENQLDELFPPSSPVVDGAVPRGAWSPDASLPQIDGYEVQGILGRGGMGVVFRAKHQKLNRVVALKMLLAGPYASPQAVARFVRESQAVAELQHPHIVQVHDVGSVDGRPYFTMEFVEGSCLSEELAGVPQSARHAAELVALLAGAIHLAHKKGIIHRDLKPANILLTEDGVPKIADFGLARHVDGDSQLTQSDARVGTPSYMAPEQALGKLGIVGPPVDIYALGAILYEMLTGRPPFRAETAIETERQVVTVEAVAPSRLNANIPCDLETICLKCLHKDYLRRYASAAELADDLHRFLEGQPICARPVGIVERTWRWAARNQAVAAALTGVAALLTLIIVGSLWAAAHFRKLDGEHRTLAQEKGDLADQKGRLLVEKERERSKAVSAEQRESGLRRKSEALGKEFRGNLYLTEMNLAGQAASVPGGLGRVGELLAHWDQERPDLRNWEWYYLNSICHQSLLTRMPHPQSIYCLAWSPNGRWLASASADHTVCVWDDSHERLSLRLSGHTHTVHCVAWSPDGQRLATGSWDRSVCVWDASSGAVLFRFAGHSADIYAVSWSPDGHLIASGGNDRVIRIWDSTDGTVRSVLSGHEDTVTGLSWNPDGRHLASASRDWTVRVWDVAAATATHTLRGHKNWVNQVAWNPGGSELASASNDETLRIWNPEQEKAVRILTGHVQGVSSLAWSPDGTRLVSCSDDQTVKVWVAATGTEAFSLRGHAAPLTTVAWSPTGDRLASAGEETAIQIWDAEARSDFQGLASHDEPVQALAWCRTDPKLFASADSIGAVKIWDTTRYTVRRSLPSDHAQVYSVAWQPAGSRLAVASGNGVIRVWNAETESEASHFNGHTDAVFTVAWAPDGRRLASGGADRTIRVWDTEAGKASRVITNHQHNVNSVTWSPDGRRLASASSDTTVKIWDLASDEEVLCYRGHRSQVVSVAWSPDGARLASAGHDQTILLWDASTGKTSSILRGHTAHIAQVIWSSDGTRLASASRDGTVKVWDAATGREALTLASHTSHVNAIAWSPDGMNLISAGMDRQVHFHDATIGCIAARSPRLLSTIDQRLSVDPSRSADWRLRGEVHARQHDWNTAADDARKCLSLEPPSAWFIPGCWITGPYPEDLSRICPPEEIDFFESQELEDRSEQPNVNWQTAGYNESNVIDFRSVTDRRNHVSAYALFPVYSLNDQRVSVLLGSDDQARLWCNGELLYESLLPRAATPDEDAVSATLHSGWNALLVRVVNETGDHALYLRLSNSERDLARVRSVAE
jgi:WD40 repeat protein